ncbi:hypothetical protein PDO_1068 [Rhizobium sp. PDO1-076]|nr:hypothetical protein PDO_1068 [Rhizobium sp. PDO1-076]
MWRTIVNVIIELMYLFAYNSVAGPRAFILWVGIAMFFGSLLSAALTTVPFYTVIVVILATTVLRPWTICRWLLRKPARSSHEIGSALVSPRGR